MVIPAEVAAGHHLSIKVYCEVREYEKTRRLPNISVVHQVLDRLSAVVSSFVKVERIDDDLHARKRENSSHCGSGWLLPLRFEIDSFAKPYYLFLGARDTPRHALPHVDADTQNRKTNHP